MHLSAASSPLNLLFLGFFVSLLTRSNQGQVLLLPLSLLELLSKYEYELSHWQYASSIVDSHGFETSRTYYFWWN
jgi:hypothetical protein